MNADGGCSRQVFTTENRSVSYLLPPGRCAKYCDQCVRMFVCLFVFPLACLKNYMSKFSAYVNYTEAVARSSSDDNVIRYALPVLWMTSFIHVIAPIICGTNAAASGTTLRECFVEFARWQHRRWSFWLRLDACFIRSSSLLSRKHPNCSCVRFIFFSPRDAMLARYMLSSCVRPSVRHTPVLYQNG